MNQSRWCWCPQPERTDSDNKCNKCGKLMRTSLMYDVGLGLANQQAHGRIYRGGEGSARTIEPINFTHKPQYMFSTSRWYRWGIAFGKAWWWGMAVIRRIGNLINKHILGEPR